MIGMCLEVNMPCHQCGGLRPVVVDPVDETITCRVCRSPVGCRACGWDTTVDHHLAAHPEGTELGHELVSFRTDVTGVEDRLPWMSRERVRISCADPSAHVRHLGAVDLVDRREGAGQVRKPALCLGMAQVDPAAVVRMLRRAGLMPSRWRRLRPGTEVLERVVVVDDDEVTGVVSVRFDHHDRAEALCAMLTAGRVLGLSGLRLFRTHPDQDGQKCERVGPPVVQVGEPMREGSIPV